MLTRTPRFVEHGRRIVSDVETVLVRRFSYASPVSPELVRFTAYMIAATRLDVISSFLPSFSQHDKRAALAAMRSLPVLIIVGDHDLLTPAAHSADMAALLPQAHHVVVPRGGHLLMLEHPDVVTPALIELIDAGLGQASGAHAASAREDRGREPSRVRRNYLLRRTVASLRGRRPHDGAA
jgi:pimeloyl-ACP methyl ester carboxylesterase